MNLPAVSASTAKCVLVLALVTGWLAWSVKESVHDRVVRDTATIRVLLKGNLNELPFRDTGVRIHSWVESLNRIAERPVTGWGRKARSDVFKLAAGFPDDVKARFGHLHNGYLEILIGFGAAASFLSLYSLDRSIETNQVRCR